MLQREKSGSVGRPDHKREHPVLPDAAAVLAANVKEVRAVGVSPVFIVNPEALLVSVVVLEVEMVNQVIKGALLEVSYVGDRQVTRQWIDIVYRFAERRSYLVLSHCF